MTWGPGRTRRRAIIELSALAVAPFLLGRAARGAIDARTVDPMTLQLVDWLNLGVSDRSVFIKGFSVGWFRDLDPESEDIVRERASKLTEAIDLQLTKLANQPLTAHVPLAAAFARAALIGWLPPFEMLGEDWKKLQMRHRVLTLRAMVTGAHSKAVWQALGEPQDSDTLSRGLSNPRRIARSPIPLNPNLMLTRLIDFYVDEERLKMPLADAVLLVDPRTAGARENAETDASTTPDS